MVLTIAMMIEGLSTAKYGNLLKYSQKIRKNLEK